MVSYLPKAEAEQARKDAARTDIFARMRLPGVGLPPPPQLREGRNLAETFRAVVPQGVRDVLGALRSGEAIGNYLSEAATNLPGIGPSFEGRQSGTRIGEALGDIPYGGPLARRIFDFGGTPLAAIGGFTTGAKVVGEAAAGGLALRKAAQKVGFGETGQTIADVLGSIGTPAGIAGVRRARPKPFPTLSPTEEAATQTQVLQRLPTLESDLIQLRARSRPAEQAYIDARGTPGEDAAREAYIADLRDNRAAYLAEGNRNTFFLRGGEVGPTQAEVGRAQYYGGQPAGQVARNPASPEELARTQALPPLTEEQIRAGNLAAVERAGGSTVPVDPVARVRSATENLLQRIQDAKPLQEQNRELLSQFRRRQAGAFARAAEGAQGETGFNTALGAMRGQAERVSFEPLRGAMTLEQTNPLFDAVLRHPELRPFEQSQAGTALRNILDGTVPTPSALAELERAFPGVTKALQRAKIVSGPRFGDYARDIAAVPQSLRSAFDLSGLRQTATFAYAHPIKWSKDFLQSLKALTSERAFAAIQDELRNKPYAELRRDAGVRLNAGERALSKGEGTLISDIVNKIPGYRASQRAYTSLVNLSRDDTFAFMLEGHGADAANLTEAELKRMGKLANIATGSGSFPQFVEDSKLLSGPVFWAPRLVASRFEMPFEVFSSSPVVRKEAARQIVAFVGVNSVLLGLLKASGAADVEIDPRSSDFGQIRLGRQRIDPWFGYRPIANLVARMASGEGKSPRTGDTYDLEHKQIVADFLRQKFSPLTSVAANLWTGRDAIGNPYGWQDAPADLTVGLFLQDIADAVNNEAGRGLPAVAPGVLGFGVQSRPAVPEDVYAQSLGAQSFTNLLPSQQAEYKTAHPEVVQQMLAEQVQRGSVYAEAKQRIGAEQVAADTRFESGDLNLGAWQDQNRQRAAALRESAKENFPEGQKPDPSKPWELYYAQIDQAKRPDGSIDFAKVDAWRASLSDTLNAVIDKETGLGGSPIQKERRAALNQLEKDGYFDMQRYRGLRGSTDDEVDQARQAVSAARQADRRLQAMSFEDAARYYLRQQGLGPVQIADAVNAGSQQYENPTYTRYKAVHRGLLAWLQDGLTYRQIKAIEGARR